MKGSWKLRLFLLPFVAFRKSSRSIRSAFVVLALGSGQVQAQTSYVEHPIFLFKRFLQCKTKGFRIQIHRRNLQIGTSFSTNYSQHLETNVELLNAVKVRPQWPSEASFALKRSVWRYHARG